MSARVWTIIILSVVATVLVAWDIYVAFFNQERKDTVSKVLLDGSKRVWLLPYAWGVMGGHLFFSSSTGPALGPWPSIIVLIGSGVLVSLIGCITIKKGWGWRWPVQVPMLLFMGVIAGYLLWPQGS